MAPAGGTATEAATNPASKENETKVNAASPSDEAAEEDSLSDSSDSTSVASGDGRRDEVLKGETRLLAPKAEGDKVEEEEEDSLDLVKNKMKVSRK